MIVKKQEDVGLKRKDIVLYTVCDTVMRLFAKFILCNNKCMGGYLYCLTGRIDASKWKIFN